MTNGRIAAHEIHILHMIDRARPGAGRAGALANGWQQCLSGWLLADRLERVLELRLHRALVMGPKAAPLVFRSLPRSRNDWAALSCRIVSSNFPASWALASRYFLSRSTAFGATRPVADAR